MKRPGTPTYPKIVAPWDLEPHYSHHVGAMTSEGLHDKADIAFQLALRDKQIAELEFASKSHRDHSLRASGEKHTMQMALGATRVRLAAISRIVRRALACGQLDKLEDATKYLEQDAEL